MRSLFFYFPMMILSAVWIFGTGLIDFLIVPNLFQEISSTVEAGNLGAIYFSAFNKFEIIFALFLLTLSFKTGKKPAIICSILLTIIAIVYTFYLTPIIDKSGTVMESGNSDAMETFSQMHQLYAYTDSVKLILLVIVFGYCSYQVLQVRRGLR